MAIFFHDVSKYQGAYRPDGPVIARCSYGTVPDPQFAGIRERSAAGGHPFLAYHYLTTGSSVKNQVDHVHQMVGDHQNLMIDFEAGSGHLGNFLGFADEYNSRADLGHIVLGYIPHWYWQQVGSPSLTGLTKRGCGLVSSSYGTYSDHGVGWNAYGGVSPVIWQFSDSHNIDTNAYRGTVAQLRALFEYLPEDEVTQEDITKIAAAVVNMTLGKSDTTVGVALQSKIAGDAANIVLNSPQVSKILDMLNQLTTPAG